MLVESDGVRIRAYLDSNSWSLHLAGQRNCWGNSERKVSETSHSAQSPTWQQRPRARLRHPPLLLPLLCKEFKFALFLINQSQISKAFRLLTCNKQHVMCQLHHIWHFLLHWSLLHSLRWCSKYQLSSSSLLQASLTASGFSGWPAPCPPGSQTRMWRSRSPLKQEYVEQSRTNKSVFIGPESDHWLCLSLTDWLTDWLTD